MTILVVGASGYLGGEVVRVASDRGIPVAGTSTTGSGGWSPLDITSRTAVLALLSAVRPQVVVNAAASMSEWRVTADGAANVALAAVATGARLVQVSTDALHAGRPEPYVEADVPTPVTPYGAAKAAAETAVAAIDPGAVIVRTSLIIGTDESKHIRTALDMITGRRPGVLFTDEIRCPVHVADLAAAIVELGGGDYAGVLNVAGPQPMSRADLGRLVARRFGLDPSAVPTGRIADAGLGPRPGEVRLDCTRARDIVTSTRLRPGPECVRPGER